MDAIQTKLPPKEILQIISFGGVEDNYVVDAQPIMDIFGVELSKPIYLNIKKNHKSFGHFLKIPKFFVVSFYISNL